MTAQNYLFHRNIWRSIHRRITASDRIFLLLDYDGTLVPIKKRPSLAILSLETRSLILQLAKKRNIILAIVTGRSLSDIRNHVRIDKIIYAANHGFQISSSRKSWIHPDAAKTIPVLLKIEDKLIKAFKDVTGILIENKRLTLSIHYRNMKNVSKMNIRKVLKKVIQPYDKIVKITSGKKVFEVRPPISWDKGHATLRILKMFRATEKSVILFVGDDKTDEDAFELLPSKAVTIRVGKNRYSKAKYFVRDTSEVHKVLKDIISFN